jgi:hypothetical protein
MKGASYQPLQIPFILFFPYSPNIVEDAFWEIRLYGVLRSSHIFLFSGPYRRVVIY